MKFLCRILGHKYEKKYIDKKKTMIGYFCRRCGKNRDLYKEGETKDFSINYYNRNDGKKEKE